jgi:hypothetical protein
MEIRFNVINDSNHSMQKSTPSRITPLLSSGSCQGDSWANQQCKPKISPPVFVADVSGLPAFFPRICCMALRAAGQQGVVMPFDLYFMNAAEICAAAGVQDQKKTAPPGGAKTGESISPGL